MDQPQPVSRVLSVLVHAIMTEILSTFQCRPLSCPHDLESGVLSDTGMDHPCGEGGPMLQSQGTCSVLALPRGPCPQNSPACRRQKTHSPGGKGSWLGRGRRRALWSECGCEGRGALQGVLLRCHCPCQAPEPTCHSEATLLPPEAQIRNEPE